MPYTLMGSPIDPFKGTLKGSLITTPEPPSRLPFQLRSGTGGPMHVIETPKALN